QFDLDNGIRGYSNLQVQGVAYWLGEDSGITHTFTDTEVRNGQTYYYAVTAYDRGAEEFNFYPSENAITISRTPRGAPSCRGMPSRFGPIHRCPGTFRPPSTRKASCK